MVGEGAPSGTARRVAAYRLTFERLPAPYGNAAADERLARDVAGRETPPEPGGNMWLHLRGRTAFFDRVVVNAMERDVSQVVSIAAGYDGRALRYAKPGVHWWEVDHPDTQADKRARLEQLSIPPSQVSFVPFDLRSSGLAPALLASGYQPDAPGLVLCEGIAVYLDVDVLEATLHELRSLATVGTRLAISWRPRIVSPDGAARREAFEAAVAAAGEPARNQVTAEDADHLLANTRWRPTEISSRARQAGFAMAAPVWAPPAAAGSLPTAGAVGAFMDRTLSRSGADTLAWHLESTYGVNVATIKEADLGVFRVDLGKHRWIARLFPASRSVERTRDDHVLLTWLRASGIPAEQPATSDPVSVHEGQPVLVTIQAQGKPPKAASSAFAFWGEQLGRLHQLTPDVPAARRAGGAWHHLVLDAGLAEEAAACAALLHAARPRVRSGDETLFASLADEVADLRAFTGLPHAFGHADAVPRNVIIDGQHGPTVIDWAGSGWFPRVSSLGCLLWAGAVTGRGAVQAAARAYARIVKLDPAELEMLGHAMRTRPLVLAVWTFATGRASMADVHERWQSQRAAIGEAQATAAAALRG